MDKNSIIIIGASGHGKVVLSTLLAAGKKVAGFIDDNPLAQGISGYKVLGDSSSLENYHNQAAIIAIGDNNRRKAIVTKYPFLNWVDAIHPSAYIHPSVKIGKGTVVFAGAIIQPDAIVGEHCIVNTAATIDHDCIINSFVHIAPGSHLAGNVRIGEGSFLGIGTNVIPNITVGNWVILGAGSVVVNPIANHVLAKGIPAKVYKTINCD